MKSLFSTWQPSWHEGSKWSFWDGKSTNPQLMGLTMRRLLEAGGVVRLKSVGIK